MAEGREAYAAIGEHIVNGFDAEYYLMHNPDVAAAGIDALTHYNTVGWQEGRNPERILRHRRISGALCRRGGGRRQSAAAL